MSFGQQETERSHSLLLCLPILESKWAPLSICWSTTATSVLGVEAPAKKRKFPDDERFSLEKAHQRWEDSHSSKKKMSFFPMSFQIFSHKILSLNPSSSTLTPAQMLNSTAGKGQETNAGEEKSRLPEMNSRVKRMQYFSFSAHPLSPDFVSTLTSEHDSRAGIWRFKAWLSDHCQQVHGY